jgi:hypothetical protein
MDLATILAHTQLGSCYLITHACGLQTCRKDLVNFVSARLGTTPLLWGKCPALANKKVLVGVSLF